MSDRDEFYRRFSKSYDKLHQSEMQDDLVDRVALAIDSAICGGDQSSVAMELTSEEIKVLARAAIALALEEAAQVCDPKGDCSEMDAYGKGYAAAIRAMIPKENK